MALVEEANRHFLGQKPIRIRGFCWGCAANPTVDPRKNQEMGRFFRVHPRITLPKEPYIDESSPCASERGEQFSPNFSHDAAKALVLVEITAYSIGKKQGSDVYGKVGSDMGLRWSVGSVS
jgi:hypothetical protein